MQIIYPGQHPMIGGFMILVLAFIGIIGLILFLWGISLYIKKTKATYLKLTTLIIGSLLLLLPIYNWINYNLIHESYRKKLYGKYENIDYNYTLVLNNDGSWISNHDFFNCKEGNWEFLMTEDINYIQLNGSCTKYFFLQIYSFGENYIKFGADQNSNKHEPVLKYNKINN